MSEPHRNALIVTNLVGMVMLIGMIVVILERSCLMIVWLVKIVWSKMVMLGVNY